ncbi:phospho-sugar mutase [Nitriliruptor alkaliphilus]|uniref:phospho-sugar mutase n=1 Tax=Nitriliruptor alkaliphilus TaxID=427918 RepID=UPI000698616E|nr:phospho-sugar mutase [Nitriliruptor alkaliphilus]
MTITDPTDLHALAEAWADGDVDEETRTALRALMDGDDLALLTEHVGAALSFGTAGLRGEVGPGPNRMNRAVVIRTTRGLADFLLAEVPDAATRGVVVGFDARTDSARFAADTVGVLAAAGIEVRWFPTPQPTPLIAYAQKALDAAAAVVVTASHNPPADNGYKVYVEGAAQIVPPTDAAIAAAIEAVGPAREVPLVASEDLADHPKVAPVDAVVVQRFLQELEGARPPLPDDVARDLTIVYTPLHGVAGELIQQAFALAGFDDLHVEPTQAEPDGTFPTVAFPNPEEPGALDAALALARDLDADLLIANDPDGDRLAVAVPDGAGGWLPLSGNRIGVLLGSYLLDRTDASRPLGVRSVVSSPMFDEVCDARGARFEATLTGFKWIARAARELEVSDQRTFVFGFEEALGSTVGSVVRDKDGIGAAVAFAEMVALLHAEGRTVLDRIRELSVQHGAWVSHQVSVTRPGAAGQREIADAMALLSERTPHALGGLAVTAVTDYRTGADQRPPWLAATDLVECSLDGGGRAMIRPSGTEPKCKVYVDLRTALADDTDLASLEADQLALADRVGRDLLTFVGLQS